MAATAAHLIDRVLPDVPVRQWVLSLPFELRFLLATDRSLLSAILRIFIDLVFQRYRARFRSTEASRALWATGTNGRTTESLVMQGDGNLVLYAPGGHPIWASGTDRHQGAFLAIQDDGNTVVYTSQGRALWDTKTRL